ncbi:hypothetical protein [Caldimonas sp. KR1-144]|uniref:hypothetical protein n=1 Tax=Caldimonas sp. KR1-144 TaxID=3400911 RepID=UPI003C0F2325
MKPRVPVAIRDRVRALEREGVVFERAEQRKGTHFFVWFKGIPEPLLVNKNPPGPRAEKNLVAHLRRLIKKHHP